MVSTETEVYL